MHCQSVNKVIKKRPGLDLVPELVFVLRFVSILPCGVTTSSFFISENSNEGSLKMYFMLTRTDDPFAYILYPLLVSFSHSETRLEGWLSLPVRNNTKKFGWEKKVERLKLAPMICTSLSPWSNLTFPCVLCSVPVVCCSEQQEDSLLQQRARQRAVHSLHGAWYRVSIPPKTKLNSIHLCREGNPGLSLVCYCRRDFLLN